MTLFQYGFRPFFPLAGLAAAAIVVATVLGLTGTITLADPIGWHAHEMLFGFAPALLAGFFLTAVPNWTQRPRVHGPALVAFAGLWLAGRAAMLLSATLPAAAVAGVDVAFVLILGVLIGWPIFATASQRNYAFPVLVWILAGASLADHLQQMEPLSPSGTPRRVAIVTLMVVIITFGGRIVPLFTRGALRRTRSTRGDEGPDPVRARGLLDSVTLTVSAALIPLVALVDGAALAVAFGAAAILNALRMWGWASPQTVRDPLLLILHVGYAWVPMAFALNAISLLDASLVPASAGLHAMTAGVLGTFAMGMMSRVMRGHTGRPLVAPPIISAAYALLTVAAVVRVAGPIVLPAALVPMWHTASGLWALAFVVLVVVDLPIALAPRPDGKPG